MIMAIISREHNLLFIMVPGTGSSVVGRALQDELNGTFLPERSLCHYGHTVGRKHNTVPELIEHDLLTEQEHQEYFVFGAVRNPFDRWVTYYQRYEGDWVEHEEDVLRRQIDRDRENFDLSDEEVERRMKRLENKFQRSYRRQKIIRALGFNVWMTGTLLRWALDTSKGKRGDISRYAFPMLGGVDAVIRQERLNDGLNRILEQAGINQRIDLPHRNTTSGKRPYAEYYSRPTRLLAEQLLGDEMEVLRYKFEGPIDDRSVISFSDQHLEGQPWE